MVTLAFMDVNLYGSSVSLKKNSLIQRPLLLLSILIFTILIGCRYDVGIDWKNYKTFFEDLIRGWMPDREIEYGYFLLIKLIDLLGLNYVFLFIFIAFLQIMFLYARGKDFNKVFPFLLIFSFTMGNFVYSLNIMKQMMAIYIIFYGTKFIINKNLKAWLLICILAFFIHRTAIICIPFYFLNKNLFKFRIILVSVLLTAYLVLKYIIVERMDVLLNFSNIIFNQDMSFAGLFSQNRAVRSNGGSGLFFLAEILIYSIMIFYYHECSNQYKNIGFYLFFNLSALGIILFPLVSNNILLDRIVYYFGAFKFVTFGFYTHYFICIRKNWYLNFIGKLIIIAYFINFLMAISASSNQCSPFQFIW